MTPKSVRVIDPVASKPQVSFLLNGLGPHFIDVIVRVTGLLTPRSVRSPVTVAGLAPFQVALVDLKVIVGFSTALRKSGDCRCASRLT